MENDEKTQVPESPAQGNDEVSPSVIEALGMGETPSPPPQADTDAAREEHKERTRLGRRMSQFEQDMESIKQTLTQLNTTLSMRQEPYFERAIPRQDEKSPVEYIATPEDLEKHLEWKARKEEEKRNAYAGKYVHTLKNLSYMNSENLQLHQEIEKELLTNVSQYPTYSNWNDPMGDARTNYLKAENKILKQIASAPKANVKGGPSSPPGITASSRMAAVPEKTIKLDEHAEKFLRGIGEDASAEWVKKSLGGDK